jgi:hypothetical protein
MREMPRDQLADFLNDATGVEGGGRKISEDLEKAVFADFADVLEKSGNTYSYTGAKFVDKYGMFAGSYDQSQKEYGEQESLISGVNFIGVQQRSGTFTAGEAQGVLQHEVALTSRHSTKPVLGTYGAGPCIIVAAHNEETGEALLAHVDSLSNLKSLSQHLDKIGGSEGSKIRIHLLGGDTSSRKQASQIVSLIKGRSDTEIVTAELCAGGESKSLALDARTGEVFTTFRPQQLDLGKDSDARTRMIAMQFNESPLTLTFDGTRESVGRFTAQVDDARSGGGEIFRGGKRTEPKPREGGWAENS